MKVKERHSEEDKDQDNELVEEEVEKEEKQQEKEEEEEKEECGLYSTTLLLTTPRYPPTTLHHVKYCALNSVSP
ncbi:hypothetical protein E2C01_089041 [Portunus trituberculatus]|uniref:Uncharacterized protein n=1 Tax=Portunus trituberculatus TaxID=210409 RepID=A0A5B7JI16_PORTR|nr:hypothetical protein [Portunus trituberculatus]